MAGIDPGLFQFPAQGVGDDLPQLDGGAAGGVFLQAVMGLDDLHVVAVAQHPGDVRHHLEHQVDPDAHVGGEHQVGPGGQGVNLGDLGRRKPGGPQDHGLAGVGHLAGDGPATARDG